jgi:hypothetical protein
MRQHRYKTISLEAVDFQRGLLFKELTDAIEDLRKDGKLTTESLKKIDIPEIVMRHTGLLVSVSIEEEGLAHIHPPLVDKNHPFILDYFRGMRMEEGVAALRAAGTKTRGLIDRKRSRVDGIFSKMQGDITLGSRVLKERNFTSAEIAAIILHELGHLFTYFEYLGNLFTTNYVMSTAARACFDLDDYDKRVYVLTEAEYSLGIEFKDKRALANTPKKDREVAIQSVILAKVSEKTRSELGTNLYDIRSWEQLSDQFAARHGAGKDLVIALDKLYQGFHHRSSLSTSTFLVLEAVKVVLFLCAAFLVLPAAILYLAFTNPLEKIYDEPAARIKMIRQQISEELKDSKLSDKRRKALLGDIELIKDVEDQLTDRESFLEFIWAHVIPWGRKAAEQEQIQKQLEALTSNELFVVAAKFKVGASNA